MKLKWFLRTLRQALRGEEHDYTKGDISESVILLAVPMVLEIGLESVFAVVDMFFVSKLGANAIATVGLTESVLTLIYSIAIGLSVGATALVSRRVGEKNFESAAHSGAQSLLLGTAVAIVISILGAVYASEILQLMGASPEVVRDGSSFTRTMMAGCTAIVLLFLINGVFRGAGNAAMAMRSLWIASGVNIVLCPLLIHFYGLQGAAFATVIGRSTGVIYQVYHLFKGTGPLKFVKRHFHWDGPVAKTILDVATPASFQFLIGGGSWILLTRLIAETGGTEASAAYQIAFRAFMFFILPAWGLSNAAATLVGQNLGAQRLDRAEQSVFITARFSAFMMGFVALFFLLMAPLISALFTADAKVAEYSTLYLRVIGSGFVFYGVGMVMMQAFNGAGDTKTSTWINFLCFWVFQTPLAYFLALHLGLQSLGVVVVIPMSQALLTLLAWVYFKKGRWKKIQV